MSENYPLVSIVTPSFNSGDFLEEAISSVTTQDYPNLEHLIIDGGSTDNTLEILHRSSAPVAWVSEPDEGQADAINKGFQRAKGEIIGWLNADDAYQPGAIRVAVDCLQRHPDIDLVYGHYNFIDADGKIVARHTTSEFSLDRFLYGDAIIPQTSMFFRKRVIETIGGVKPELHYVMDWEFAFRIALDFTIKRVDATWGNFRVVPGTKSVAQPERFWPEIIAVVQPIAQAQPKQFTTIADEALFMNHLYAGLEFARYGQRQMACHYFDEAFKIYPDPQKHAAVLASALFKTATYPWHSAFTPHPLADQALDNICTCLNTSQTRQRIQGYLWLYRALRALRQGNWQKIKNDLALSIPHLRLQDLLNWPSVRMMLGAILK